MKKILPILLAVSLFCLPCYGEEAPEFPAEPESPAVIEDASPLWYPYEITTMEDGSQTLILKRYQVPGGTPVEELEETTITRMGNPYTLWAVVENGNEAVTEEKQVEQDFTLSVHSCNTEEARSEVKETILYEDEEGYSGEMSLTDLVCSEEAQADGTYLASVHYEGTACKTRISDAIYTLYYAPVYPTVEAVMDTVPSFSPPPALLAAAVMVLGLLGLSGFLLKRKHTGETLPSEQRPSVYVPATDIVLGASEDEDDD